MRDEIKDLLNKRYSEFPGAKGGMASQEDILAAESELNTLFSDTYKEFLRYFGGGLIGSYEIFGVKKAKFMSENHWSVIQNTQFYKQTQKWPDIDDWYIISDDSRGNPIGCKPDGSVWLSDHDAAFQQVKLADSFEDFTYRLLTDTLYE